MASAVGNMNFDVEFAFPTSKEMGHPFLYNPKIEPCWCYPIKTCGRGEVSAVFGREVWAAG